MSIYIDQCKWKKGKSRYCHMASDNPYRGLALKELHEFAEVLGLKRSWFDNKERHPHYDLTALQRDRAIELGAHPVTTRQLIKMCTRRVYRIVHNTIPYCRPLGQIPTFNPDSWDQALAVRQLETVYIAAGGAEVVAYSKQQALSMINTLLYEKGLSPGETAIIWNNVILEMP